MRPYISAGLIERLLSDEPLTREDREQAAQYLELLRNANLSLNELDHCGGQVSLLTFHTSKKTKDRLPESLLLTCQHPTPALWEQVKALMKSREQSAPAED